MIFRLALLLVFLLPPALRGQSEGSNGGSTSSPEPADDGEATITATELLEHLTFLASDEMRGRATGSEEIARAGDYIIEHMKALELEPAGAGKSYESKFSAVGKVCRNLCARIEGTDSSLRREHVVFGAHYDHVGVGTFGSRAPQRRGEIHNGADDNASGTSSLLELMEAFAKSPPKRSVLFLAFSGEELGLLGSKAWVRKPTVPLRSLVTMINLDMVGRSRDAYLFVGGLNTGTGFEEIVRKENEPFAFALELNGGGRGPSDFDSFYEEDIPVLFFFTAEHGEYHTPDDDVPLINTEAQASITRLAYRVGKTIANGSRPRFQKDDRQAMPASSSRGVDQASALLGIKLGEATDGEAGVPIANVVSGGVAGKAGIQEGDRLLLIDGVKCESPRGVQSILAIARPGSKLKIQVLRGKSRKLNFRIVLRD